jgi:hypothetical protein
VTQKDIRVGIVGANAKSGWAKMSHVPAINGLPGLKLAAVATRNEQIAREAAEAFGADRWFSDPFAMICDDQIDVITIAVKVPAHRDLVLAAPGCWQSGLLRGASRAHRSGGRRDGEGGRFTPYRDRIAGSFESSRTTCGPVAFLRRDWTATERENRLHHQRLRAGNAFHA